MLYEVITNELWYQKTFCLPLDEYNAVSKEDVTMSEFQVFTYKQKFIFRIRKKL